MKKSRALISVAAAGVATFALLSPAAGANPALGNLGVLDSLASQAIKGADCNALRTTLTVIDQRTPGTLLDANTTRSQLSRNLQQLAGENLAGGGALVLPAIKYSAATADRALECQLVKADPGAGLPGFDLSSKIADYAPALEQLSSTAR